MGQDPVPVERPRPRGRVPLADPLEHPPEHVGRHVEPARPRRPDPLGDDAEDPLEQAPEHGEDPDERRHEPEPHPPLVLAVAAGHEVDAGGDVAEVGDLVDDGDPRHGHRRDDLAVGRVLV